MAILGTAFHGQVEIMLTARGGEQLSNGKVLVSSRIRNRSEPTRPPTSIARFLSELQLPMAERTPSTV
jgi:hypothetical protein